MNLSNILCRDGPTLIFFLFRVFFKKGAVHYAKSIILRIAIVNIFVNILVSSLIIFNIFMI